MVNNESIPTRMDESKMNPMTRTRSYQEAQASQRFAQQQAANQSAKDSELSHRAKLRNLDDDELRAACGAGPTNLGAPPRRR